MNIHDLEIYDLSLFYFNALVAPAFHTLEKEIDDYAKKQGVDIISEALEEHKPDQKLASDLGHYANAWNVDWLWIAFHINNDYSNIKRAKEIANFRIDGLDALVYKQIDQTSSPASRQLYLTDPTDFNSAPKIFKLKDLAANGSNLGKPPDEWKPIIGVTDFGLYEYYPFGDSTKEVGRYWDHSRLSFVGANDIWDKEKMRFVPDPHAKRKVERKSKVGAYIKDENGQLVDFEKSKQAQSNMKVQVKSLRKRAWWKRLLGIK